MIGVSWQPGCPVPIDDLRIIEMNHWGFDGEVHEGGLLMVHEDVADDVVAAFGEMFAARFPIRRMELIEQYGGSDDASMAADNTSAFNCRPITGSPRPVLRSTPTARRSTSTPSRTPTSRAPPCCRRPERPTSTARTYGRGMIVKNDEVVKAFKNRGFDWGGGWHSLKDYQHFEAKKL